MIKRDYRDYIKDIVDTIRDIKYFVKDMNYHEFLKDKKTIYAVVRGVEIIGEATKSIPRDIQISLGKRWLVCAISLPMSILVLIRKYFGKSRKMIYQL